MTSEALTRTSFIRRFSMERIVRQKKTTTTTKKKTKNDAAATLFVRLSPTF